MRNVVICCTLLIFCSVASAQDTLATNIKALLDSGRYEHVIDNYLPPHANYSAKALYYTGFACFMKEDNDNCIRLMTLAIKKDPGYSRAYFIRAATYNYMARYDDAVKDFRAAIALNPEYGEYYSGLGDAWYNLQKDSLALQAYIKAGAQADAPERAFLMIPQLYAAQKEEDKALDAYYIARYKVARESDSYSSILYNIALFELQKGNYEKAETALQELLQLAPDDYQAYAKLIQVYYGRKEYQKAQPWKDKLYEAHRKGLLTGTLQDKFCFDQFKWQGKLIQVYERYEEGSKKTIYNKHLFYVLNAKEQVEFRMQTEYSPLSAETNGPRYLLCLSAGNTHSTFNIGFGDDLKYEDLKAAVISVLEGKVKPVASSWIGK
ncbi:MAG: tetratricopeptide repeat protein [Chitinophagaceae bacterium]